MARPSIPLDTQDLVRRYKAGETVLQMAEANRVSHTTIQNRLRKAGVLRKIAEDLRRYKRESMIQLPTDELTTRYRRGESPNEIAEVFGVSRTVIGKRLTEAGLLDWRKPNRGAGEPRREEALLKRALTGEQRLNLQGSGENWLASELEDAGFSVRRQAAVDRYNVDILLNETIAVEVMTCSGVPYMAKTRYAKRLECLLKRYVVLVVWSIGKHTLCPTGTQHIVSLCKKIEWNPATTEGEYWVVWGSGELLVVGSDPNEKAFVPSAVRALNRRRFNPSI